MSNPSQKTNTTQQKVFERTAFDPADLNNCAIFTFGTDSSRPGITQITLPEKSTWTPGPHWHETHIEYFRVLQGRVLIKLGDKTRIVTREDGNVIVQKYLVHEFMRADRDLPGDQKDSGDVVTEEWTDPADGIKHVFFRNIFSTLQDSGYWGRLTFAQALYVAASHDDFIVFVPGRVSYAVTHLMYGSIRLLGPMLGLKPWVEEYTPLELRGVASGKAGKGD